MENPLFFMAARILQRFYRNYIQWERLPHQDDSGNHLIWPRDVILDEPFDPSFSVRILNPTNSLLAGKRHKLQLFNINTLWQSISITHRLDNPVIDAQFTKDQFLKIGQTAIKHGAVTEDAFCIELLRLFPQPIIVQITPNPILEKIKADQMKVIVSALCGDDETVLQIILENDTNISHDLFLPNKFYSKTQLIASAPETIIQFPPDLTAINLLMAIAYGCNYETFVFAWESGGCDPTVFEPVTGMNVYHIAAMAKNTAVLQVAQTMGFDFYQEAENGLSVIALLEKVGLLEFFVD